MMRLLPLLFRLIGFKGTVVLALGIGTLALFTGNLGTLLGVLGLQQGGMTTPPSHPVRETTEERQLVDFVSVVLADTEVTWQRLFSEMGATYKEPVLVLYRDAVHSACGTGSAAMGPFYCPGDRKIYIDLGFYDQLRDRHGAPGDFAQAYVIAHEVGHHVQTLLGTSRRVHAERSRLNEKAANQLLVRQELQADCFSGIWAHHADRARQLLEAGDVEEALAAASAIGDDTLQKQSRGYVTPDSFTHGSAEQRVRWFRIGLEHGSVRSCDTFVGEVAKSAGGGDLKPPG